MLLLCLGVCVCFCVWACIDLLLFLGVCLNDLRFDAGLGVGCWLDGLVGWVLGFVCWSCVFLVCWFVWLCWLFDCVGGWWLFCYGFGVRFLRFCCVCLVVVGVRISCLLCWLVWVWLIVLYILLTR